MHKLLIIFLFSGIMALTVQGQTAPAFHHQIGVSGSTISGMGISYQYIFSDNYRMKLSGFVLNSTASTAYSSDDLYSSIGLEGQKTLFLTEATRLYVLLGVGMYRERSQYFPENGFSSYARTENTYTGGTGFGIELIAAERISFHFDVGLAYTFKERKYASIDGSTPPVSPTFRSEVGIGIAGGLGFGYRF